MKTVALLSLFCLTLEASEVSLDFTIGANSGASLSYRIGTQLTLIHTPTFFQDIFQTQVNYSGNILAEASVNSSNGSIESIQFTGGSIVTENVSDFLSVTIGTVPYTIFFSANGITRTASSNQIEVLNNSFLDGAIHFTTLTGGMLEVINFNSNATGATVSETVDFATQTSDLIANDSLFPVGMGAISIGSTLESDSLFETNYSAQLFTLISAPPLTPDATIQAADLPIGQELRQRYTEIGNLSANTTFSIPNAFGQWVIDNGLDLTTGQEQNAAGFPFALLFAFGLSSDATSLPLEFIGTDPVTLRLTPPPGGLGFTVAVDYSPDLVSDFAPLDPAQIQGGANQLNRRATAPIDIVFPSGSTGYLRFSAGP